MLCISGLDTGVRGLCQHHTLRNKAVITSTVSCSFRSGWRDRDLRRLAGILSTIQTGCKCHGLMSHSGQAHLDVSAVNVSVDEKQEASRKPAGGEAHLTQSKLFLCRG